MRARRARSARDARRRPYGQNFLASKALAVFVRSLFAGTLGRELDTRQLAALFAAYSALLRGATQT